MIERFKVENTNYEIVACDWYTPMQSIVNITVIGIVLIEDKYSGYKAYIGTGMGVDEKADCIRM